MPRMDFRGIIFINSVLLAFGVGVYGFPMEDLISKLPGQPDVPFRQFSGYIDVDENIAVGRSLFYYFAEAENDPLNKPLTIWLTGGPGCSSVGDGFTSVGPFITTKYARGLEPNPFSWIKVTNLLFIDCPIGAGWTYSNTSTDYLNTDESTNKILVSFMQKWIEKYPDFKSKDLYIAGSSYAGHFIPNLAVGLLDDNKQSNVSRFNLKGLIMGNPMLRRNLDMKARPEFLFSRGMINISLYTAIQNECTGIDENNYASVIKTTTWSEACEKLVKSAGPAAFKADPNTFHPTRLFDVTRRLCDGTEEDFNLGKAISQVSDGVDMCAIVRPQFYFNIPEVQKAFHGNRTNLPYPWLGCNFKNSIYADAEYKLDMLPAIKNLIQQSVRITIFSGEVDCQVPTMATVRHLTKLAEELNIIATKETWKMENKKEGSKYTFGDLLTLFSFKGGNHHVTASRPAQALYVFANVTTH